LNEIETAIRDLKAYAEGAERKIKSDESEENVRFYKQNIISFNLAIKALEKQLNGGWVPVNSGKLPENKKIVLITRSTGSVGLGFCNRNSSNHWRDGEGYLLSCPLAWRELPEPYKEDEKN